MKELKDLVETITRADVSRREFLKGLMAMGVAAAIYGCDGDKGHQSLKEIEKGGLGQRDSAVTVVPGAAPHNCGGRCVTKAYVENGVIKKFVTDERPDKNVFEGNDPQLRACLKCRSYRERLYHPGRLLYPMKQTKQRGDLSGFVRISWEEAIDTIASELERVKRTYGNEAIYNQYCTGEVQTTTIPVQEIQYRSG